MEDREYDDVSGVPVEDAMTLQEHDFRYHHGRYRDGDDCLFRERMAAGDDTDAALNEANELEAAAYYARENEIFKIRDTFHEAFDFMKNARRRKANGVELRATNQAKNGDRWVMIFAPADFDDKNVSEGAVRKVCGELGYDFKAMKVGFPHGRKEGEKKMYAILMNNPNLVGSVAGRFRNTGEEKKDAAAEPEEKMSDEKKSEMLKRFGLKVVDGKVQKRGNAANEGESAARRYLRLVDSGETMKKKPEAEAKEQKTESDKHDEMVDFMKSLGIGA